MAINYFIGWNQQDLEAELRAAQEDLAAGKNTIKAGVGEVNVESRVEQSVQNRIKMILQALNKIDPEHYPIDQVTATTATRACFSGMGPFNPGNEFP